MSKEKVARYISEEYLTENHGQYTVAMIKPDGVASSLMEEFENEIKGQGLSIDFCFPVSLHKETIFQAFKVLRAPSDFSDNWQDDVADALSSGPCLIYIISGESAVEKVLKIKRGIRGKYLDKTQYVQRVLKNLLHSSDSHQDAIDELTALVVDIDYAQILLATGLINEEIKGKILQEEGDQALFNLIASWIVTLSESDFSLIEKLTQYHWFLSYSQLLSDDDII